MMRRGMSNAEYVRWIVYFGRMNQRQEMALKAKG